MEALSVGVGRPVIVLQGGPGFSHHYLTDPLRCLEAKYRFVVPSAADTSGRTAVRNFDEDVSTFCRVANDLGGEGPLRVLAHSWGGLVLLAALTPRYGSQLSRSFGGGVIVTPLPAARDGLDAVAQGFRARIPLRVKASALCHAGITGNTERLMRLLLPFYGTDIRVSADFRFGLNLRHYFKAHASVGRYAFEIDDDALRGMTLVITERDITPPNLVQDLTSRAGNVVQLLNCGHFPMIEQPERFLAIISECL